MHVMIDLETMGNRPDAPIVAIGAVKFDAERIRDEFYVNVDLKSAVEEGGAKIDADTVMWWMKQDDAARGALEKEAKSVVVALYAFRDWLKPHEPVGVWGNGATFDNVILSETYRRLKLNPPWPFWADRCYRTVKNLYPDVPLVRSGTHHNAVDDARTQAEHLIAISKAAGGLL